MMGLPTMMRANRRADVPDVAAKYFPPEKLTKYYEKVSAAECYRLTLAGATRKELPSIIRFSGQQEWRKSGELHRDADLPALISPDGDKSWYVAGKLHRDHDQPAVVEASGERHWYQSGKQHRDGGLPAAIFADGAQEWWVNGVRHRDDGRPATTGSLGRSWFVKGTRYAGFGNWLLSKVERCPKNTRWKKVLVTLLKRHSEQTAVSALQQANWEMEILASEAE